MADKNIDKNTGKNIECLDISDNAVLPPLTVTLPNGKQMTVTRIIDIDISDEEKARVWRETQGTPLLSGAWLKN